MGMEFAVGQLTLCVRLGGCCIVAFTISTFTGNAGANVKGVMARCILPFVGG